MSVGFDRCFLQNPTDFFCQRWFELVEEFLPVYEPKSFWRYSRLRESSDLDQGWKIHISATILNAVEIFQTVNPFLKSHNLFYKAPNSLSELKKLNAGIFYDYTQIGKFITIYPQSDEQAVKVAEMLHLLTGKFSAPAIPFETRLKSESCVYYRYGAFKINWLKTADGKAVLAMQDDKGDLIPDLRESNARNPKWISNPFPVEKIAEQSESSPLQTRFKVFRALSQRGKGGVYQGFDLSGKSARFCLVKEGRRNGETEWNGRDGFWRIKHETAVLKILKIAKVNVPEIYATFEAENNFYLATEFIEGENLHVYLKKRKRRLKVSKAMNLAVRLAKIISQIHTAGWLWRDCKPENIIVTKDGKLRPLDFEGACLISEPDLTSWTTLKARSKNGGEEIINQTTKIVDFYALGVIIYLLFEGNLPAENEKIEKILRKNVPLGVKNLVLKLLDPRTAKNLSAEDIAGQLEKESRKFAATRKDYLRFIRLKSD